MLRAIDVAILLPPAVHDLALELSAALPVEEAQGLRLDAACLPHITLAQAFVEQRDVATAQTAIDGALAGVRPLDLTVTGAARSHSSVSMVIAATTGLRGLHLRVMQALAGLERADGDAAAFYGKDGRDRDVNWVARFRQASSFEHFRPHVTLGHAERAPAVPVVPFSADTVALCHLGRFCTCREVLHEWTLS